MSSYPQGRPRTSRWAIPNKLRQLQYRSYVYSLSIYHFRHTLLSVRRFETQLTRQTHGFVARLVSDDPIASMTVTEGDEIPSSCYEVAYLPNSFQNRGSALGFRIPGSVTGRQGGDARKGKIEWLCFETNVQEAIEAWMVKVATKHDNADEEGVVVPLFDRVAVLEKAATIKKGTVQGHREHRNWYQALERAVYPVVKLKLTWKNKERDRQRELRRVRQAAISKDRETEGGVAERESVNGVEGGVEMRDIDKRRERRDDEGTRPLTPNTGPLSTPTVVLKSRIDRQAGGEYV